MKCICGVISKTAQLKVENSAQTTSRFSPVSYRTTRLSITTFSITTPCIAVTSTFILSVAFFIVILGVVMLNAIIMNVEAPVYSTRVTA